MLGKLIKHEFKATYKIFLLFYFILVVFTLIGKLMLTTGISNNEIVNGLLVTVYVIYIVALFIATTLYLIIRYYKNLFSDEGYLMFTLPVKPIMLYFSKLFVSLVWNISTTVLTLLSIGFLVINPDIIKEMTIGLRIASNFIETEMGMNTPVAIILLVLFALLAFIYQIVVIYSSINIGQLAGKHRILGSVAAYMIIYIIMQVISFIMMFAGRFLFETNIENMSVLAQMYKATISYSAGISILVTVILTLISNYILNRKLNLE